MRGLPVYFLTPKTNKSKFKIAALGARPGTVGRLIRRVHWKTRVPILLSIPELSWIVPCLP
jgi:hypothetical protein